VHKLLVFWRVSKEGNRLLSVRQFLLLICNLLGNDLVCMHWSRPHEEVGRVAAPEDLGKLLEVDLAVLAYVDEGKDILELLIFRKVFGSLQVEFLHHSVELLEGEISTSWVVPFPEGVLGGDHIIMQKIADVLQFGLEAGAYILLVFIQVEHLDEVLPIDESLRLELAVVQKEVNLF
jgi:hypothetical protein